MGRSRNRSARECRAKGGKTNKGGKRGGKQSGNCGITFGICEGITYFFGCGRSPKSSEKSGRGGRSGRNAKVDENSCKSGGGLFSRRRPGTEKSKGGVKVTKLGSGDKTSGKCDNQEVVLSNVRNSLFGNYAFTNQKESRLRMCWRKWMSPENETPQTAIISIVMVIMIWWAMRVVFALFMNIMFPLVVVVLVLILIPPMRGPMLNKHFPEISEAIRKFIRKTVKVHL